MTHPPHAACKVLRLQHSISSLHVLLGLPNLHPPSQPSSPCCNRKGFKIKKRYIFSKNRKLLLLLLTVTFPLRFRNSQTQITRPSFQQSKGRRRSEALPTSSLPGLTTGEGRGNRSGLHQCSSDIHFLNGTNKILSSPSCSFLPRYKTAKNQDGA